MTTYLQIPFPRKFKTIICTILEKYALITKGTKKS